MAHPDDIISFYDALLGGGTPNLLELTNVTANSSRLAEEELLVSMVAHLPHIQVLEFDYWSLPLPLPASVWPKHLRRLRINVSGSTLGQGLLVLPESLEKLELAADKWPSLHSIQWPPNLLKLELEAYYEELSLEAVQALPRSLKDLRLPRAYFENTSEFWKALPPNLTRLELSPFEEAAPMIELLPRTLKRCHSLGMITLENVKLLPPSLTTVLDLGTTHDPKIYELLPTGMREMSLYQITHVQEGDDLTWTRLPDTLELIDGLDACYLDHFALPSCLRSLTLSEADLTDKRLDRLVSSKLRFLSLNSCKFDAKAVVRCLPQGLTSLTLSHCVDLKIERDTCKLLPKTLLVLDVSPVKFTRSKALTYLPAGLEKLIIHSNRYEVGFLGDSACALPKLRDLAIHVDDLTPGLAPYLFGILPRKLKNFTLIYPNRQPLGITDATLESLPPGLLMLTTSSTPSGVLGSWLDRGPKCLYRVTFGDKMCRVRRSD